MKKIYSIIITHLFILTSLLVTNAHARTCVSADDLGISNEIEVASNPKPEDMMVLPNFTYPVAKWIDASLYTTGIALESNYLKIYVTGYWEPWKYLAPEEAKKVCKIINCNASHVSKGACIPSLNSITISDDFENGDAPCRVTNARPVGLYGLIALAKDGVPPDNPNIEQNIVNVPSNSFRTFHLGLEDLKTDVGGTYFLLTKTQWYEKNANTLITDIDTLGNEYVISGRLYFKIIDNLYSDNNGIFKLKIVQGAYDPKNNFIERTLKYVEKIIQEVTVGIYQSIVADSGFISLVNTLLVFYASINAILYMMGIIQSNKNELIIRLVKISIVVTLISPESWNFFNDYLFSMFIQGGKDISKLVFDAAILTANNPILGTINLNSHVVAVFDKLLPILFAEAVWIKIYALLFSKYIGYSLIIIISIFILTFAILKALVLLFVVIFQLALLLAIVPFFIIMILFNVTKELFDKWILQMMATTVMYILLSVAMILGIIIVFGHLEKVMRFPACSKNWLFIPYYDAFVDPALLEKAQTAENVFGLLFMVVIFLGIISELPKMIDALANAPLQPITSATSSFMENLGQIGTSTFYRTGNVSGMVGAATATTKTIAIDAPLSGTNRAIQWMRGR
jgi:type IV secretion system protein VirB6